MYYVIANNRGQSISGTHTDRRAVRKFARRMIRTGKDEYQGLMIFLSDEHGKILKYSSEDTAAIRNAYEDR